MQLLVRALENNYDLSVNVGRSGLSVWLGVSALLLLGSLGLQAQTKFIRLRNEVIATRPNPSPAPSLQSPAAQPSLWGLFLIQFNESFRESWKEQLREAKVELLRPVPDDAFVAHFDGVRLSQLQTLPFVYWVGEYRPNYRVHSKLLDLVDKNGASGLYLVSVLLSTKAPPIELLKARRTLRGFAGESKSRFGIVMRGEIAGRDLGALAQSPSVLWIESQAKPSLHDEIASKIVAGGASDSQTNRHATVTQELGFDGTGLTVAVADSGLNQGPDADMHPDLKNRVDAFFYYGTLLDAADQHSHGTHVAGIIAGDGASGGMDDTGALYGLGIAPKAHLVVQRIFDGGGSYEAPSSFAKLTRDAVRAGAVIGSNSWGDDTQGRYDINAMEFDALVRDADPETPGDQPYVIEFSSGNAGPGRQTMGTPAVAKNVIAAGASQNNRRAFTVYADGTESMADFSSRGPCEDGRIKPDLVAPGTWVASLRSAAAGEQNAWLPISADYMYLGGTSQSTAAVAGASAVFVQYYRQTHANATPSPALVKAALINSATDMNDQYGTGPVPNNDEGWGRLDLSGIIGTHRALDFLDQSALLATGQAYERRVIVAGSKEPLRITLAYTDVPGLPAAIPALVNDLDLEVVAPDGRVYRGNGFDNGESIPGAQDSDSINNVEAVHIRKPVPGEYLVRVRAARVTEDARVGTARVDQDFALVVSGDLSLKGAGVLIFNQNAYSAPSLVQLKLIDFDLAGRSSVSVRLNSTTETNGEIVLLRPLGSLGVFTGTVATATGPIVADGQLQIKHGDKITALYQDASPASGRSASALADLQPPELIKVSSTNRFGKTIVSWETREPANSVVRYGTNRNLSLSTSSSALTLKHEVALENLRPGATYFFTAGSSDEAGNTATNDNRGNLYTCLGRSAATVLLVNAYKTNEFSPEVPLHAYTDALDQTGVTYEIWNVQQSGSPSAGDLRPFRIVIWRISDSIFDDTTLTAAQQTAIQEYLGNGGSFFMASMEILSRLGDVPFRSNVLHVQKFVANALPLGRCDQCDADVGVPAVLGPELDPLTSGFGVNLDYANYPVIRELGLGPDFGDTFTPSMNAVPILINPVNGKPVGLRYPRTGDDTSGRVVFLSIPLDAIPTGNAPPNNRANLLRNILSFLAPGVNGLGTIALDKSTYTVPGRVTVEVADSDLIGKKDGVVQIFSDTATNGQPVKLTETVRPGLFRGFIALVAPTNAPAAGQLRAKADDFLHAEYLDESAKSVVRAVAKVDTAAPAIARVTISSEYETALVSWDTSEPADALVQFGESTFLGRTSYNAELTRHHELRLVGLRPNRLYYCQVVSRDPAGNSTLDDDRGRLYTFRTLKPAAASWSDTLEKSNSDWVVINGENSAVTWKLGLPANGKETAAHSPTNAWGTNLEGEIIDAADTRLVGPAIELTGGTRASLSFWHSFDFTEKSDLDIFEFGRLAVSTNNGATWLPVAEYRNASAGWVKAEANLTPYLGKIVRLSWHYGLLSLDSKSRPGWLVDDISINVSTPTFGTIQVSNDLAQAAFTLSGPVTQSGEGLEWTLTNAPTGEYVIKFKEVPYYETPAPQTNVLTANAILAFEGNYTFADLNNNGISDAWERHFFGEVSPTRTKTTDSDRDGLADLSEFVCGTNPMDPNSRIRLTSITPQSDGTVRLTWRSVPGRAYRVLASTNALGWNPLSPWLRAIAAESSQIVPGLSGRNPFFYRLEVHP